MQLNQKRSLYLAIGLAALTVMMVAGYLSSKKRELLMWSEPVVTLVATRDILENVRLDESMVREEYVPKRFAQPGALGKLSQAVGTVTIAPVRKNEQITDTKVVPFGSGRGLSVKIGSGMRAVSVAVDEVSGVAGMVRPNDLVDIIATFDFGSEAAAKVYTYTILQGAQVVAVGDDLGAGDMITPGSTKNEKGLFGQQQGLPVMGASKKTVTLALTPDDAQKVILAQETGSITLALRPSWEKVEKAELEPATPASVTGIRDLLKARNRPVYREYKGR